MRIARPQHEESGREAVRERLEGLERTIGVEGRVCGRSCTMACPKCGSTGCQCMCAADCPNIPTALSSDPEDHPLEAGIAPLVFEMQRLGVFVPCWSCEGHLGPDGRLWKLPRVWFYCDSAIHLRLLTDALKELELAKTLSGPWQVRVGYSDPDNPETTFSLEPDLTTGPERALPALQRDAAEIARRLEPAVFERIRDLKRNALDKI